MATFKAPRALVEQRGPEADATRHRSRLSIGFAAAALRRLLWRHPDVVLLAEGLDEHKRPVIFIHVRHVSPTLLHFRHTGWVGFPVSVRVVAFPRVEEAS